LSYTPHTYYPLELTTSATLYSTKPSAHWITAQYLVLYDGLTAGHLYVVALAISSAALQLGGNQTDSFAMKGGWDKATT